MSIFCCSQPDGLLTFEGQQFQGTDAIREKMKVSLNRDANFLTFAFLKEYAK